MLSVVSTCGLGRLIPAAYLRPEQGQKGIHGKATLPLNRALGMAFGRGITASECARQIWKLARI